MLLEAELYLTQSLTAMVHGLEVLVDVIRVAFEDGSTTAYALLNAQERCLLFVFPRQDVHKGQIVGIHQRAVGLDEPLSYSLDDCIEHTQEDEIVEVTPASIRMCKNPKISKKK
ncbi:hypothetical protein ACP70R_015546 [Stipagrostis hirtigluma subsp. patula]